MNPKATLINKIQRSISEIVDDEQEAQKYASAVVAALNDYDVTYIDKDLDAQKTTDILIEEFLTTKTLEGLSSGTIRNYRYILKKFSGKIPKKPEQIQAGDIRAILAEQLVQGLSPRTLNTYKTIVSSFYTWMEDEGYVDNNPVLKVADMKEPKRMKTAFSAVEIEMIREACATKRDRALVETLLSTGCRINEVVSLKLHDVDFDKLECTVIGKGDKQRVVYLNDVCAMFLKDYLRDRFSSTFTQPDDPLFMSRHKRSMTPRTAEISLSNIGKRANVENVHPHRFRRTLATNMIRRKVPIEVVSRILGHTNISTTTMYVALDASDIKKAYENYAV